eukprot:SAG31_NODE_1872_length_7025_cov_3.574069_5_plen_189_part_00
MEVLLRLSDLQARGMLAPVQISGAALFSGWLDLTDSSPTYVTERSCGGECNRMGTLSFPGEPGVGQFKGSCAAVHYAGRMSINHPLVSPMVATRQLLARLPPTMLIVGANEQLVCASWLYWCPYASDHTSADFCMYGGCSWVRRCCLLARRKLQVLRYRQRCLRACGTTLSKRAWVVAHLAGTSCSQA